MSDVVVKVEGLSKKFCRSLKRSMFYGAIDVARSMFGIPYDREKLRKNEFWALDDINFELKKGETLGLIGQNGCGKTTLLRLINGIFPPDKGKITIRGRIGALIAVGAGFHPHMTGRENIYLNGTILGMKKDEIKKKFDSIVDFAEIGEFIDAPVSTYSSGMTVRLGFSIAIHSDIDILLADEVLAVGDVNFQKKCFEKIIQFKRNGIATVFVSHSISTLERMCDKGVFLAYGKQMSYGNLRECIKDYMKFLNSEKQIKIKNNLKNNYVISENVGIGSIIISDVFVYQDDKDKTNSNIEVNKDFYIEFNYKFKEKKEDVYQVRITIRTYEGHDVQKFIFHECPFIDGNVYKNEKIIKLNKEGNIKLKILNPKLFPQTFRVDIAFCSMKMDVHEGGINNATIFQIVEPKDEKYYFEYGNMTITDFDYLVEIN